MAQVYGLTTTPEGVPAMVMELVEGETLADLAARGPVAVPQAQAMARQVADGLEAAHDAGVIHRDLKSANVIRFARRRTPRSHHGEPDAPRD